MKGVQQITKWLQSLNWGAFNQLIEILPIHVCTVLQAVFPSRIKRKGGGGGGGGLSTLKLFMPGHIHC